MASHLSDAQRRNPRGLLGRALRKGAIPRVEVLLHANDWAYLVHMEKAAIATFGTCKPHGYNNSVGGEGSRGAPRIVRPRAARKEYGPRVPKHAVPEIVRGSIGYNAETGVFWWKAPSSKKIRAGSPAGHVAKFKRKDAVALYLVIRVHYRLFLAHRIAWLLHYGELPLERIDHIDGDSLNNRISNLRLASNSQNCQNSKRRSDNKSGYKGVSWDKINNKWVARIRIPGGGYKNLGRFICPMEAHQAYCAEAKALFGVFARAG